MWAKNNTSSPESSLVNSTILNLHGKLTEKHDQMEKVQSDSFQCMDRNMSEIPKLCKIINKKVMEICTLKVENAKLMYSQRLEVTYETRRVLFLLDLERARRSQSLSKF